MIKETLLKEIQEYCKINNIQDVEGLINKMLQQGFTIEKFGNKPQFSEKKDKNEVKANKYNIKINTEEEKIIEETVIIKRDYKENIEKDIYGE